MPSSNEVLADRIVNHQVYIQRYGAGTVRRIIGLLNRTDTDLIGKIEQRGAKLAQKGFDAGPETTKRLDVMLGEVRALNKAAYQNVGKELTQQLKDLAEYEADWQGSTLESVLPDIVTFRRPPTRLVAAAATSRPFQGRLLSEWLDGLENTRAARIRDAIRVGLVQGETIDQMIRRIRGTRALGYADGLMAIDRRGAATMVRTAVNHTANVAREATWADNADILKGLQWHSTLDGSTCPACGALDGKVLQLGKGPRPPQHHGCRCTTIPLLKSWRELGIDIDEMPESTRASMNGQVPESLRYGDWLKKQSATFQDETLGAAKGALFRTGKLPIDRFVDKAGNELSLKQLQVAQPAAYKKAGLDNPMRPPRGEHQDEIAKFLASTEAQQALLKQLNGSAHASEMATVRKVKAAQEWDATDESLGGVRYYTGNGYGPINQRMRDSGGTLTDRQFTALSAKALEDLPEFTEAPVYRAPTKRQVKADRWWDRAVVGEPLDLGNQLQSFSRSAGLINLWDGGTDVVFRIEKPRGGAYVEALTQNPGEYEVLLPPGQRYRVVAKSEQRLGSKTYRVIDLEIEDDG